MRLLQTTSLAFEEFYDWNTPAYAILSHRWEEREPTYQSFLNSSDKDGPEFAKIREACRLADENKLNWIWIDTICIDKTSSAELSEAINSMFKWYQFSTQCFTFLSDVESDNGLVRNILSDEGFAWFERTQRKNTLIGFEQSKWFTCGWTLQELAPTYMIFYDRYWRLIGSREAVSESIEKACGIRLKSWVHACIAQKMSWMARRRTSRGEGMAYSLMGLFDVNMPLLYGEGEEKAFIRLQLEIIKKSDDASIFAWIDPASAGFEMKYGLLAMHPAYFKDSADVFIQTNKVMQRLPYAMTNKGLGIQVPRGYEL